MDKRQQLLALIISLLAFSVCFCNATASLRIARSGHACAAVNGVVLIGGGTNGTALASVEIVNATSGNCSDAPSGLSIARTDLAVATVTLNNTSYVVFAGGKCCGGATTYSVVDIFDALGQLVANATLVVARSSIGVWGTAVGELAFFAGGGNQTAIFSEVDIWNATDNTWTVEYLRQPRRDLVAISFNESAFFAGGVNSLQEPSSDIDIYNTLTRNWTYGSLSEARSQLSAAATKDVIVFSGGLNRTGFSSAVDVWNLTSNNWTRVNLPEPRIGFVSLAFSELVVLIGGRGISLLNRVDVYNATNGKFFPNASLTHVREDLCGAKTTESFAILAGGFDVTYQSTIDILSAPKNTSTLSESKKDKCYRWFSKVIVAELTRLELFYTVASGLSLLVLSLILAYYFCTMRERDGCTLRESSLLLLVMSLIITEIVFVVLFWFIPLRARLHGLFDSVFVTFAYCLFWLLILAWFSEKEKYGHSLNDVKDFVLFDLAGTSITLPGCYCLFVFVNWVLWLGLYLGGVWFKRTLEENWWWIANAACALVFDLAMLGALYHQTQVAWSSYKKCIRRVFGLVFIDICRCVLEIGGTAASIAGSDTAWCPIILGGVLFHSYNLLCGVYFLCFEISSVLGLLKDVFCCRLFKKKKSPRISMVVPPVPPMQQVSPPDSNL